MAQERVINMQQSPLPRTKVELLELVDPIDHEISSVYISIFILTLFVQMDLTPHLSNPEPDTFIR